jgi:hypothetical protein
VCGELRCRAGEEPLGEIEQQIALRIFLVAVARVNVGLACLRALDEALLDHDLDGFKNRGTAECALLVDIFEDFADGSFAAVPQRGKNLQLDFGGRGQGAGLDMGRLDIGEDLRRCL